MPKCRTIQINIFVLAALKSVILMRQTRNHSNKKTCYGNSSGGKWGAAILSVILKSARSFFATYAWAGDWEPHNFFAAAAPEFFSQAAPAPGIFFKWAKTCGSGF